MKKPKKAKKAKKTKKMGIGGVAAALSPVAAVAKSLESGKPEGLLKLSPLAMAFDKSESKKDGGASSAASQPSPSQGAARSGSMRRPTRATRGMKSGGTTRRGDGICQRGKTKGRMV